MDVEAAGLRAPHPAPAHPCRQGTDENESFVSDVAAAVPSRAKLLVLCDAGGTHRPVGTQLEGRRSRSLIAAYKLITAGFGDVVHVAGGVRGWGESDLALEGTNPEGWGEIQGKMPRS